MRFGPWMLMIGALGCKGGEGSDQPTGDTGDTQVVDTSPLTFDERVANILALIPAADPAAGKLLYDASPGCHECHQFDGSGTVDYPALWDRLPNIDDTRVVNVMMTGLPAPRPGTIGMPAYEDDWVDQEIADVIAYIRSAFSTEPAAK